MSEPLCPAYLEVLDLVKRRGLAPHDVVSELTQALGIAAWEHGVPVQALLAGLLIVWGELDASAGPAAGGGDARQGLVAAATAVARDATS